MPLPPLTMREFIQRSLIVGGMLTGFLVAALLVIWLSTPVLAAS